MHANGICHRDIKPSHIRIDRQGNLKLGGLHLAAVARQMDEVKLIQSTDGTTGYMASEIVRNLPHDGQISDLFALGFTFFVIATGSKPFRNSTGKDKHFRLLQTNAQAYWRQVQSFCEISEELQDLLGQLMHWDPKQRP